MKRVALDILNGIIGSRLTDLEEKEREWKRRSSLDSDTEIKKSQHWAEQEKENR